MAERRVLFVDDEPGIRASLSAILSHHGYEVTVAGDVPGALQLISLQHFDVLISDLNIGEPGDGFTVVSAMRRTQPNAVTFILTGFPGFETALRAIQEQVDGYLLKPTSVPALMHELEQKLAHRTRHERPKLKRISEIVRSNRKEMIQEWLEHLRMRESIFGMGLSDRELADGMPELLEELARRVENSSKRSSAAAKASNHHGSLRRKQGFTVLQMLEESRILRQVILRTVHIHLMEINLSYVFTDLSMMSDALDDQMEHSLTAYLQATAA